MKKHSVPCGAAFWRLNNSGAKWWLLVLPLFAAPAAHSQDSPAPDAPPATTTATSAATPAPTATPVAPEAAPPAIASPSPTPTASPEVTPSPAPPASPEATTSPDAIPTPEPAPSTTPIPGPTTSPAPSPVTTSEPTPLPFSGGGGIIKAEPLSPLVANNEPQELREPSPAELAQEIKALIAIMTSPEKVWEERLSAEQQLVSFTGSGTSLAGAVKDPMDEAILLALVPHIVRGMPLSLGIVRSTGNMEGDKALPIEWQIFYAVHRVWAAHRRDVSPVVGNALVAALPTAPSKTAVLAFLGDTGSFNNFWVKGAEKPVLAILRDPKSSPAAIVAASRALLRNTGHKHLAAIKSLVLSRPESPEQNLWTKADMLQQIIGLEMEQRGSQTVLKKENAPDAELIRAGFTLLPSLTSQLRPAAEFAILLGRYAGTELTPDQFALGYQGPNGLTDDYYTDCLRIAIAWWRANGNRFQTTSRR